MEKMEIDWNLDPQKISEIPIYQIHFKDSSLENQPETISLRLLIFSHKLALSQIPAFYLDSALSIKQQDDYKPEVSQSVIVFDINGDFESNEVETLPFWAHLSHWKWVPHEIFSNEIVEAFSRALTLVLYYRHYNLNPLYFSSYILIPGGGPFFEPFLVQPVPVLRQGSIQIRTVLQSGLDCILSPKTAPPAGSFILFPPNEHPLYIISVKTPNILEAITIDKKKIEIDIETDKFVFLTNPPLIMPKFFEDDKDISAASTNANSNFTNSNSNYDEDFSGHEEIQDAPPCQFTNLKLFNFTEKDIADFFTSKFSSENAFEYGQPANDNPSGDPNEMNDDSDTFFSVLEDTQPNSLQILSEFVPKIKSKERKKILSCVGLNGSFPTKRSHLTCIRANFLSYYRFDFGFSTVNPPSFVSQFGRTSRVRYQKLGIPYITLNKNGDKYEERADKVLSIWESERFMPISGPKDAHYAVFIMKGVSSDSVRTFMSQFTAVYSSLGFGALTPYPRKGEDYMIEVPVGDIPRILMEYFDNPTEYQQYQVLSFIVAPPIFSENLKLHSIVNYIRPNGLETATIEEVKTLAFVVYSRIRIFSPQPLGMIEPLAQRKVGVVLFGFRYKPPFLLSRDTKAADSNGDDLGLGLGSIGGNRNSDSFEDQMELHAAWDPSKSLSAWIDGIGSVLHMLGASDITSISSFIEEAKQAFKVKMKFTVTLLGEGIKHSLYNVCDNNLPPDVEIYSVSPSPSVSAHFEEEFADDVVIFEDTEQCFEVPINTQQQQQQQSTGSVDFLNSNDFDGFDSFDSFERQGSSLAWPSTEPNASHFLPRNSSLQTSSLSGDDCYVKPSATCYVLSKYQPPYMTSIYRGGSRDQLLNYVTKMSHLSWLSVKPGDEKRTISYPPHICALLRKNDCSCLTISRFEFLPYHEKI